MGTAKQTRTRKDETMTAERNNDRRRVGTQSIDGADLPVEHVVRRVGRVYYVDRRVCNGECLGGTVGFPSKKSAIEALSF